MPFTSSGDQLLADALIGGNSFTKLTTTAAYLGVGNGTTAFAKSQTDLQGANKVRRPMDSGYPVRSGNQITFQATFGTTDANFAWEELGTFNAASGGQMVTRYVQSMGTKTSGTVWVLQYTLVLQ